jgi:hypothetical protein
MSTIKKRDKENIFTGSDKSTLAFPKFTKKKTEPKKKTVKIGEKVIQEKLEGRLRSYGLKFFHIPDLLLFFLKNNPAVPQYIRNLVSEYFKGVPDLVVFHKNQEGYNYCLLLELKTEAGKVSTGQQRWHSGLNVIVTYGLKEAYQAVEDFIKFVDDKA